MSYSASKLKSYAMCPLMYYYQYILKLIQPMNPALQTGLLYHSMVEKFHQGQDISTEDALVKQLLDKYKANPVTGNIVATEERFKIDLDGIEIVGIFDRRDDDKIVEYKTTSKDYTLETVDNFQTDIYAIAGERVTGKILPIVYSVVNKKKVKTKKYVPQVIRVEKSSDDLRSATDAIVRTVSDIEAKRFDMNPGQHCYFCPFSSVSKYGGTKNCPLTAQELIKYEKVYKTV